MKGATFGSQRWIRVGQLEAYSNTLSYPNPANWNLEVKILSKSIKT